MSQSGILNITNSNPSLADKFETDSGDAVPSLNTLQVLGGDNINTSGATNVLTINLDEDVSTGTVTTTGEISSGTSIVSGTSIIAGTSLTATTFIQAGTSINVGNLRLTQNTLISTDIDGNIRLIPNGAGTVNIAYGSQNYVAYYGGGGALQSIGPINDGQLIIGATGGVPASADLTAGANIVVTPGTNSLTVAVDSDLNSLTSIDVDNLTLDGNTISSTDTNGNIVLAPDGSGVVSVTAAPIVPSGDRADSLGSAALSWDNVYCDGLTFDDGTTVLSTYSGPTSWTPALEFGGGSTGITYAAQNGSYMRIGNLIFGIVVITLTSKGTDTGAATITGFPLTSANFNRQSFAVGEWALITFTTNYTGISADFIGATSTITLRQVGNAVAVGNLENTNVANTSGLYFTFTVRI